MERISPATLEVGDVFYECEYGLNIEARVTEKPVWSGDLDGRVQWAWTAVNTQNGESIEYLLTEGFESYGPRIYDRPQYAMVQDGKQTFLMVGTP